jgi:hypothetical protein
MSRPGRRVSGWYPQVDGLALSFIAAAPECHFVSPTHADNAAPNVAGVSVPQPFD